VFASPVSPPLVLPSHAIVRLLRLITSPACRDEKRVPLSATAAMCGVSRLTLYRARDSGRVSADTAELLTPIVR
jgi:hypothetical protein